MKGDISTFEYSGLPKISKVDLAFAETLATSAIDLESINRILKHAIREMTPISSGEPQLTMTSCVCEKKSVALSTISNHAYSTFGNISGKNIRFLIELKKHAVKSAVYSLLGDNDHSLSREAELTPVEEGIFSFILSLFQEALHNHLTSLFHSPIRLGSFVSHANPEAFFHNDEELVHFSFNLTIANASSTGCLLLSAAEFLTALKANQDSARLNKIVSDGMNRASEASIVLRTKLASLEIAKEQLLDLKIGDVILLDRNELNLNDDERLNGEVFCEFGEPVFAASKAFLSSSVTNKYALQLSEIVPRSHQDRIEIK